MCQAKQLTMLHDTETTKYRGVENGWHVDGGDAISLEIQKDGVIIKVCSFSPLQLNNKRFIYSSIASSVLSSQNTITSPSNISFIMQFSAIIMATMIAAAAAVPTPICLRSCKIVVPEHKPAVSDTMITSNPNISWSHD
jgi:hypothetical protein